MVPFLLVILIGVQLAQLTWLLLPAPPAPPPAPVWVEPASSSEPLPSPDAVLQDLARFDPWERPILEEVAPPPPPPPPPPPEETAVVTELALDLIGTMILPEEASWAILVRRSAREKQISMRLGEAVDGAILERIERHAVFLRNHGRLEKLSMVDTEGGGKSSSKKGAATVPGAGHTLSRQAYNRLLSKGMGLLAGVNITPFYRGADSVGYRLKFSGQNAEMRQLGLVSGDVIRKVNGISVLDRNKMSGLVPGLKSQTALSIDVLRNGQPATLQLRIGP